MQNLRAIPFVLLLSFFVAGCQTPAAHAPQICPDEQVLLTSPANLWRGAEAVGGALTVTNRRIIFHPHHFNFQRAPEEIPLAEITGAVPLESGSIFKRHNEVLIQTSSGRSYQFVTNERDRVVSTVNTARTFKTGR